MFLPSLSFSLVWFLLLTFAHFDFGVLFLWGEKNLNIQQKLEKINRSTLPASLPRVHFKAHFVGECFLYFSEDSSLTRLCEATFWTPACGNVLIPLPQ